MKARLNRHELADALGAVSSVAAVRTPKPILQCVLVEAQNDGCILKATDLELSNPETAAGAWQAGNAAMTIPAAGTTTAAPAALFVAAGRTQLTFGAPGAGNTGYVDIRGAAAVPSWLQFDWDGNGAHDNNPTARVTFGIYLGSPRLIYIRDPVN